MSETNPTTPAGDMPKSWTKQERWVYSRLLKGEIADLNERDGATRLDPKKEEGWTEERIITPRFLKDILLAGPYSGDIPHQGVRILGAWFKDTIDLENAKFEHYCELALSRFDSSLNLKFTKTDFSLFFYGSRFEDVTLASAKVGGTLIMTGSKFTAELNMDSLQVEGSLFMRDGAEFGEVILRGAKVGGALSMTGSGFNGKLNMDKLQVKSSLFMSDGAEFGEVVLMSAKVGGVLSMIDSKFSGKLIMDKLQVKSSLFMKGGAEFGEVVLMGAKVGGQLEITGSKFSGKLVMESLQVGSHLLMSDTVFATDNEIDLLFADIGGGINLSGSKNLPAIDLTGAIIKGELSLELSEDKNPTWQEKARLTLINAKAGALQAFGNSWPKEVDLTGFTYDRLGGFTPDGVGRLNIGKAQWYEKILKRQKNFSPQPYQQLGALLQKEGYEERAREVLYAGKERQRKETTGWWRWLFMTAQKWLTGYGYYNYYSVGWVILFTLLGAGVLYITGEGANYNMPYGLAYSFDKLIPLVQLHGFHYKIDLGVGGGWSAFTKWYFYFQQLMGYVLASFLIAGLSGFTRR